jgi:hypothetical protein
MELSTLFHQGAKTAFAVFKSLQKDGTYIVNPSEAGWSNSAAPVQHSIKVIRASLTERELQNTRFYSQIKPTDVIVMVLGADIISKGIRVRSSDAFSIVYKTYTQSYEIVDYDTDPAEALYLILLREK